MPDEDKNLSWPLENDDRRHVKTILLKSFWGVCLSACFLSVLSINCPPPPLSLWQSGFLSTLSVCTLSVCLAGCLCCLLVCWTVSLFLFLFITSAFDYRSVLILCPPTCLVLACLLACLLAFLFAFFLAHRVWLLFTFLLVYLSFCLSVSWSFLVFFSVYLFGWLSIYVSLGFSLFLCMFVNSLCPFLSFYLFLLLLFLLLSVVFLFFVCLSIDSDWDWQVKPARIVRERRAGADTADPHNL